MSDPPDLDALAKRYLDLWQDQLGGIAKDRQTAEIMAQTIELMNAGATAFASMAAAQENPNKDNPNKGNADADNAPTAGNPNAPPRTDRGTNAAAAPPGASDSDLDELARRLDRLEKRLDTLEAGARKSRRHTRKKPRKG